MVWQEVQDTQGKTYYVDTATQESTWDRPIELHPDFAATLESKGWSQFTTEEGKYYYYDASSQQSVWEIPQEVVALLREGEDFSKVPKEEPISEVDSKSGLNLLEVIARHPPELAASVGASEDVEGSSEEFLEMLEEANVNTTWSFSQAMSSFINDKRYWNVEGALLRKQLFEGFLINKSEAEFKTKENSKEIYRKNFTKVLDNYDIKPYTTWRCLSRKIIDEPLYSLSNESFKGEIFEEYVKKLRVKHQEEQTRKKQDALVELETYLKQEFKVKVSDEWTAFSDRLDSDERFKTNKSFSVLTKLDILSVYEKITTELEAALKEKIQQHKNMNLREDRKARDAFKQELSSLEKNANLKWFQFVAFFKTESKAPSPGLMGICGRYGSSPIDFFWDIIDEQRQVLLVKRDLARQALVDANMTMSSTSLEKFTATIKADSRAKDFSESDFKSIFTLLSQEEVKKPHEERKTPEPQKPVKKRKLATFGYGSFPMGKATGGGTNI